MKRNFLVTTGLIDTWEFNENNFLLGTWCEFYEFGIYEKEKLINKIPKKISIIKNIYHWNDSKKKFKDHEYLKEKLELLLEIISEKLSIIHNVNENKEYWRVVVYSWLGEHVSAIFDRWENIRIFFEKNKTKKFYSNFILLNDSNYVPKNHLDYIHEYVLKDEWNHLVFLRLFHFLNIQNLSLIEKKIIEKNSKKKVLAGQQSLPFIIRAIKLIDSLISKFAYKYNKIIFESFYFPTMEYLKICLRCKLIPSKYSNLFNFDIRENGSLKDSKRTRLKNLLLKTDYQDKFIQFLLLHIHKDMPKSYLENFDTIKKNFLPLAKSKKIIFSMHSLIHNDNFKIYLAETKKVGSKYIQSFHGGSLTFKNHHYQGRFNYFEKVSDKIIRWDKIEQKQNNFINLSPTLSTIKLKNTMAGNNCSIIFAEYTRYATMFNTQQTSLDLTIELFNELTQFVNKLNPEIKSKIKFRVKHLISGYNAEKRFSRMFGEKYIDKPSFKNSFKKTMQNSKLIIHTYAGTAFSETMYCNIPTVLIMEKNSLEFLTNTGLHTFNDLKKNKIAFDDFNEAKTHINKYWNELDLWWKRENVQFARKNYLLNFFNVKSDWYKEWSDYIYSSLSSYSKSF